ncbi:MAG: DedA family protein [Proteobacteria bacterium]|jgi:membrane-associated protein|nr:DedA family protein [Pseudomonadota bacterium]
MEEIISGILARLSQGESALGAAALAAASLVEYVFPPFPGDTVTLFGAFLAATARWRVATVLAAVTFGSLAGAAIDFAIGRRLVSRPLEELTPRRRRLRERLAPIVARFERHGAAYLAVNRFLPGVRALIFVAAGAARLPLGRVLAFGAVSALLWNGLLIGAGFAVGENWEALLELLRRYTMAVWLALGCAALALVALVAVRRFRRR